MRYNKSSTHVHWKESQSSYADVFKMLLELKAFD